MSDKRQASTPTAPAWVQAQPQPNPQFVTRTPTVRGATDGLKITVFFALAVIVGLAIGYLVYLFVGLQIAVAVFVVAMLGTFVPLFVFTLLTESGYLHRKSELSVELAKIDLATIQAANINAEQQEAIEGIQNDVALLWEQVDSLKTIRIQDRSGVRIVSKRDEIDSAIDSWLAKTMFDPKGQLCGAHPSGVLIEAYPFKGKDERSRQAHDRLVGARLIDMRKPSNQYAWIGPPTLTDTRRALERLQGAEMDD